MRESLDSMLLGTSALWLALAVAVAITAVRPAPNRDPEARGRLLRLFLLGVAAQCVHVIEEFVTGFYLSWPQLLGLEPWSADFFVALNVAWIAIWLLAAVALWRGGGRWPLVPVWFFTLGMALNGVAHPLLALRAGGYFPGLASSPVVGVFGVVLWSRLLAVTSPAAERPARGDHRPVDVHRSPGRR